MTTFNYKPRTLRDVACRENQTCDETNKPPKIAPDICCTRCGHPRWAHCDVRRSRETRTVLFYARSRGEIVWVRWSRAYSGSRLVNYSVAKCKHSSDQADFPCCNSSACAVRDCLCTTFQSPYKKVRAKKATGKPRAKKAVEQIGLFEHV